MTTKRFLALTVCFIMLLSAFAPSVLADDRTIRQVYLHAQGENPKETVNVSTVYMGETTNLYFAVDNPNKGAYVNGVHTQPQYDMNGYTVKIYFNAEFFDFAGPKNAPIDYTIPDNMTASGTGTGTSGTVTNPDDVENLPNGVGYYEYSHGSDNVLLNGRLYNSAYLTVFFSGDYLPQKDDGDLWYNLCLLPLTPLKTGSTDVFIDTSGYDPHTLEIFAKNLQDDINSQTFEFGTVNGGYHHIVIKDKLKPSAPVPNPIAGSYTQKQNVTLTAEDGCDIYYSLDNGQTYEKYTTPIEVEVTTKIMCYATRITDGRFSDTVTYTYEIVPEPPYLFDSSLTLIPNIYSEGDNFTVYVSDKNVYGDIEAENEVYYTFSNLDVSELSDGTDPYTQWVKVTKGVQTIDITEKTTIRLVTTKMGELSDVAWYYLSVKPTAVTSSHPSGEYDQKIDITLSTTTTGAEIYYTLDGSDPISNGILYRDPITLATDKTIRAVAKKDDSYSEISSFYYIFNFYDDYGVDAFYPSGVYEGSVQVTLTPNNPENSIVYSTDGGTTWNNYTGVLPIDTDTTIIAKAIDPSGTEGSEYKFVYIVKPLPPVFAPESTQFTNVDNISVFCVESTNTTKDRYELFYTLDGTDPITSPTRISAGDADNAQIKIERYTVVSAVVLKDNSTYSNVVTHSYDIVTKKPVKPLTTLLPGNYTREIGDTTGFSTQFMPVSQGTDIYYTISYDGNFIADPIPGSASTIKYDGNPIEIKGNTIIKAVAVNVFGVKSDIGIFEYTITPEAPKAAPSATLGGNKLPVVPVSAVVGSTVNYTINGFANQFPATTDTFYIDTETGNAYLDELCQNPLGTQNTSGTLNSPAILDLTATLDGVTSQPNTYIYSLSNDPTTLAPPYADKDTGEYEEFKIDNDNNLLYIYLNSLNQGDTIEYKYGVQDWTNYDGNPIKIKEDTILQIRSKKNGVYSEMVSYVYNFIPLAPVITLPSGRYSKTPVPFTMIEYNPNAPTDKDYTIFYRANGDKVDVRYTGIKREITKTMSFKAYVLNNATGKVSKSTIHYYIIESDNLATGSVYIVNPYDAERISAHILHEGAYANGIKLLTSNKDAQIHYRYTYTKTDGSVFSTNTLVYDNAAPIMVNSSMDTITVYAWLEDSNGKILDSDYTHTIDLIHLNTPVTTLGKDQIEFPKNTTYTLVNDYPNDNTIMLYYTLDGSDPKSEYNPSRKLYAGETLTLTAATTVKAAYYSCCGKCVECKDSNYTACWSSVWGPLGEYKYTVPADPVYVGGGGGGGGKVTIDKTRKYTKDLFGNEHPTHIGYINGYPDGSVQPDGHITREEIAAILYRVKNHEYEAPFTVTGKVFPDVSESRWSVRDIEYMANDGVILGYPDGEFKPAQKLTRAEFASLIARFTNTTEHDNKNTFTDLDESHWAYDNILSLYSRGLLQGYEDSTVKPGNYITRAEVMTVVNKILGRNPSEEYVKSQDFNPFNDLKTSKWYYVIVLEATITHNYYLDDKGVEIKWEDCK